MITNNTYGSKPILTYKYRLYATDKQFLHFMRRIHCPQHFIQCKFHDKTRK